MAETLEAIKADFKSTFQSNQYGRRTLLRLLNHVGFMDGIPPESSLQEYAFRAGQQNVLNFIFTTLALNIHTFYQQENTQVFIQEGIETDE
jgi:hypothetical protein